MEIDFYPIDIKRDCKLKYVIISSRYKKSKWIFVKHNERETWEIPAGHIELEEKPLDAAKRELFEETGALNYCISPLFDYSVLSEGIINYGRMYFAEVEKTGPLPESEIETIRFEKSMPTKLTYPEIQKVLFEKVLQKVENAL